MMGGMARRSLALPDGQGTGFYTFDEIPDAKAFIEGWYSKLNDLPLSEVEKQQIVDEANAVFSLNIALFDELGGSPLKALWALAVRSLVERLRRS
jgi:heme oxygenase